MAFSLKLPKFERNEKKPAKGEADMTVSSVMPSPLEIQATSAPKAHRRSHGAAMPKVPLPRFLADKPIEQQIKYLAWVVGGLVFLAVILVGWDNLRTRNNTAFLTGAGEMRMLSQRLAKASSLAVQGNSVAFAQVSDSQKKFAALLTRLVSGGEVAGVKVPKSPTEVAPQLDTVRNIWKETDTNAQAMSGQEATLIGLGQNAAVVKAKSPQIQELTEQLAEVKLTGGAVREVVNAQKLVMLSQRMTKNVMALQIGEKVDPEIQVFLSKDAKQFKDLLDGFVKTAQDAETKDKLAKLDSAFSEYNNAINNLLNSIPQLVQAKANGAKILSDNEALLEACDQLAAAYQKILSARTAYALSLVLVALLAVITLGIIAKLYLDDSRRRADEAEKQRLLSETTNRDNQDAILRLMNELGDLADGDLTVTATVSENITGAIADSINYTIEELRVLVGRINDAATRVTAATEIARQTSAELIEAAQKQSREIQVAGESALAMASSMTKVSSDANESAQVARQSLAAAEKGTVAMQDSIKGMNEIRGQIQETSKRIKRLGESSQEIGEIVELISDITEQTNVLALNAAIQAASAGEAGRGFTVVAEEVQRLAERSGEATKQIAAIVKTIQTDTQDAVSAMEQSTQGVVEGAKLSDAAGQALAEIGEVSQNLAHLIEDISKSTQEQADSASNVAQIMQEILRITEQTSEGTQRTAEAVDELNSLAAELKGSVAGFKVG